MHIMYVDDSGTPSLKDDTSYYVISGVIMHIQDLHILGEKFAEFKKSILYLTIRKMKFMSMKFIMAEITLVNLLLVRNIKF